MTKRLYFALYGHPVRHSVSPAICTAAFEALNVPHVYTTIDLQTEIDFRHAVGDIKTGLIAGANVTVPYKRVAFEMADSKDESAEEVGAANVLATHANGHIVAYNTDVEALVSELEALLVNRSPLRAVIIGAGGAALAALAACKRIGFKMVCMTSRSWSSSEAMFDADSARTARARGALTVLWPQSEVAPSGKASQVLRLQWSELVTQADCIIQATSAGMLGADAGEDVSSIVPWDRLSKSTVCYDVVYNPAETPFLKDARTTGLTAEGGLGMLVRQAAASIRIWTGQEPPLQPMREAAAQALAISIYGGAR